MVAEKALRTTAIWAIGTWIHVFMIPAAEETAGGIALPETAQENYTEAQVLSAGSEAIVGGANTRCVFPKWAFRPLTMDELEGFVAYEDLIALRTPLFGLFPAEDWCMIRPDPAPRLRESEGGVMVAHYGLYGASVRDRTQALEIYRETLAVLARPEVKALPFAEQVKRRDDVFDRHFRKMRERRTLDANPVWREVQRLVTTRSDGEYDWGAVMTTQNERPRRGTLLDTYPCDEESELSEGAIVHWEKSAVSYDVLEPGGMVTFVRAQDLCAVEIE